MRKNKLIVIVFTLVAMFTFSSITSEASSTNVMWGKTELKVGQIGKVTLYADLATFNEDGSKAQKVLPAGGEYRVYTFLTDNHGGAYGVGGGLFVDMNGALKYETPSKAKLALLEDSSTKVMWGKTELKAGQIGKVTLYADMGTFNADGSRAKEVLPAGGEYRVYTFRTDIYGGEYGVGGGLFVHMHGALNYETPSRAKLALLK